jgi:hypothetical protein
MNKTIELSLLSDEELLGICGGLPVWVFFTRASSVIALGVAVYEVGHGFYDGFTGRTHN